MEKVRVRVEGISPLLIHRFTSEDIDAPKGPKKRDEKKNFDNVEGYLYRDRDGDIVQPATHLIGALKKAGAKFQLKGQGKLTYKNLLGSGAVLITPDMIPHEIQEWEIDTRAVVIGKARIMRSRPILNKWALSFEIEVDEDEVDLIALKEILDYAGRRVGIGDFRPEKGGSFGRFQVTLFEKF